MAHLHENKARSGFSFPEIEEKLRASLTPKRFDHTLGVTYTACALAMCHGADLEQARLAGLLHDCAKCLSDEEKLHLYQENKDAVGEANSYELSHPGLLHAKLGAFLATRDFGVSDSQVLDAIRYHTTGRPGMSLLEKIIYIADYIEPHRHKARHLQEIRALAFSDLDACLVEILEYTLVYLQESHPKSLDPKTAETLVYYRRELSKRESGTGDEVDTCGM